MPVNTGSTALAPLTLGDLKDILGRALLDPAFRSALTSNPALELAQLGILASPGAVKFFSQLKTASFDACAGMIRTDTVPRPPAITFLD